MVNIRNELGRLRTEVWHILQMDYNKRADFIPAILGRLDGILEIPKRNCEVGTAEEQIERFCDYCWKCDGINCNHRLDIDSVIYKCAIKWSQMPYEKGKTDEQ